MKGYFRAAKFMGTDPRLRNLSTCSSKSILMTLAISGITIYLSTFSIIQDKGWTVSLSPFKTASGATVIEEPKDPNWVDSLREITSRDPAACEFLVLDTIFTHIKPRNKHFVEFGFGYSKQDFGPQFERALQYTKSYHFNSTGWRGWMFDAYVNNPNMGIYKEVMTPTTIVEVFQKYKIPKNVDFVCIDVDSIDLWLLQALLQNKAYAPTLINIEYNSNFPYESAVTCGRQWEITNGDMVFGSSVGAILMVAKQEGYVPIHMQFARHRDVYLVHEDVLAESGGKALSVEELKTYFPLPRKLHGLKRGSKIQRFLDFKVLSAGGSEEEARESATAQLIELNRTLLNVNW